MKLCFTHHAQSQVLARHVTMSCVADIIRRPDFYGDMAGSAMFYRKRFENGTLEVVCKKIGKNKNEYLVLTVYFL